MDKAIPNTQNITIEMNALQVEALGKIIIQSVKNHERKHEEHGSLSLKECAFNQAILDLARQISGKIKAEE
jgi:hypothetical protein